MSEPQPRPRHTTMAAGLIIGGSALVVVTTGERLTQLRSLETQEVVEELLKGTGLGWSVGDGLEAYRIWLMVVAACAAAAAVLGTQVLRRSHGARIGLGVLAVPLFFGGLASSGFLTAVVTASIVLLWSGPTALWFRDASSLGSSTQGFRGELPAEAPRRPQPEPERPRSEPAQQPPPASASPSRPARRPDAVVWACSLTWAFAALAAVVVGASALLVRMRPSLVLDEVQRSNPGLLDQVSRSELVHAVYLTAAVAVAWSVAASVLAVLAYRRVPWARTAVVVSAAATAALCALGTVTSFLLVLPGAAAVAVLVLLNRPDVRGWYAGRVTPGR